MMHSSTKVWVLLNLFEQVLATFVFRSVGHETIRISVILSLSLASSTYWFSHIVHAVRLSDIAFDKSMQDEVGRKPRKTSYIRCLLWAFCGCNVLVYIDLFLLLSGVVRSKFLDACVSIPARLFSTFMIVSFPVVVVAHNILPKHKYVDRRIVYVLVGMCLVGLLDTLSPEKGTVSLECCFLRDDLIETQPNPFIIQRLPVAREGYLRLGNRRSGQHRSSLPLPMPIEEGGVVNSPSRAKEYLMVHQITDLHIGALMPVTRARGLVQQAVGVKPDLILLTGDFFSPELRVSAATPALRLVLQPLLPLATAGRVFACLGNHDAGALLKVVEEVLAEMHVILLQDEVAYVRAKLSSSSNTNKSSSSSGGGGGGGGTGRLIEVVGVRHDPSNPPETQPHLLPLSPASPLPRPPPPPPPCDQAATETATAAAAATAEASETADDFSSDATPFRLILLHDPSRFPDSTSLRPPTPRMNSNNSTPTPKKNSSNDNSNSHSNGCQSSSSRSSSRSSSSSLTLSGHVHGGHIGLLHLGLEWSAVTGITQLRAWGGGGGGARDRDRDEDRDGDRGDKARDSGSGKVWGGGEADEGGGLQQQDVMGPRVSLPQGLALDQGYYGVRVPSAQQQPREEEGGRGEKDSGGCFHGLYVHRGQGTTWLGLLRMGARSESTTLRIRLH